MDDQELRQKFEVVRDDIGELKDMLNAMRLSDAEDRAAAKVIAGNLDNAASALANAALSIQKGDLKPEASHEKWLERVILILLGMVCSLIGLKTLVPKLFGG